VDLAGATIVFDLDGTLVDTAPDLLRALNRVLDLEGLPHPAEAAVRGFVGHGARALIERATAFCGAEYTSARMDQLTAAFIEFYSADIAALSRPFPHAVAALDDLAGGGAAMAVCTNKPTGLSVQLLEALGLGHRFAAIVGADSVAARKPDPRHLLDTISRAGGEPARAIMVGDSGADAAAAKAAAVPFVLATFGYGHAGVEADVAMTSFKELGALARRILKG
jgi:phosphoglycolate phosphatase